MKLFLILLFVSCSKLSYIVEQGVGQVSLEYNDIDVENFLHNPKYDQKFQDKVLLIQKAKQYFYEYFELKPSDIYDEVKLLDQEAVTFLVIHSPQNEIRAIKTSFPIVGSFPYLGFFSKHSALAYKTEKEQDGFHVYMRPVFAYSTLNHPLWPFDDNILSSFFHYNDHQLVELIFHELVHTVFFVKNDMSFNENFAQFLARELVVEFFKYEQKKKSELEELKRNNMLISNLIIKSAKELTVLYQQNQSEPNILKVYLENNFYPQMKNLCLKLKVKSCWPLRGEWNNARFAAFGTYEKKQDKIEELFLKKKMSLKNFFLFVIDKEQKFKSSEDFLMFLTKGSV